MLPWAGLGNPKPRINVNPYRPIKWQESESIALPEATTDLHRQYLAQISEKDRYYNEVVKARRTRYEFGRPPIDAISLLFDISCRVRAEIPSSFGFPLTRRQAPSAGGVHPIHLVLHFDGENSLCRYDPFHHSLCKLRARVDPAELRTAMNELVDGQGAMLLMMVAEPELTATKYLSPDSLVWRDAGVLLGFLVLAAESLFLNFVPLGVTGDPWAGRLVDQAGLVGVGAALIGSRPCVGG